MKSVELSIFSSLESLFKKLDAAAVAKMGGADTKPLEEILDTIVFHNDAHDHMESIRTERANTLLALSLVPWPALAGSVLRKNAAALEAEIGKEPSKVVQQILLKVKENMK